MASDPPVNSKLSGYLEKKAKIRFGSLWKKYWFVLEGRLLLYYRSKDEYDAISPCKGSINLCPPCTVKTVPSINCVFHIEYRGNTIALRAEDRVNQEKWMHAILAALAQSKSSPTKMCHFRYSLDDLPTPKKETKKTDELLNRQNTLPHRVKSLDKDIKIIERMQQIGAQSYGGSLGTISKLAANKHAETSPQEDNTEKNTPQVQNNPSQNCSTDFMYASVNKRTSKSSNGPKGSEKQDCCLVENDEYCALDENIKPTHISQDNIVRNKNTINQNIYERISSSSSNRSSDGGVPSNNKSRSGPNHVPHLYERLSQDSTNSDNQNYMIDNAEYGCCDNNPKEQKATIDTAHNHEYSVPQISSKLRPTDHNKNSVLVDNDTYIPADNVQPSENVYAVCDSEYPQYDAVDGSKEIYDMRYSIYEDPDVVLNSNKFPSLVNEPRLPPRPEMIKQESSDSLSQSSSCEEKPKRVSSFKKLAQFVKSTKHKDNKPSGKTRKSFIHRVLRRKTSATEKEEEILYEAVDYQGIQKQLNKGQNDVQVLSELQKILEARKQILEQKILTKNKNLDKDGTEVVETIKEEIEESQADSNEGGVTNCCPMLPPRQNCQSLSPYHDIPKNNNPITDETQQDNKTTEDILTIDEILEDLNKQKDLQESKQKVKQLIEKFNEIQNSDEVILRKKADAESDSLRLKSITNRTKIASFRYSDDLNKLLDELSKVTCAPILTPGVTSSLVATPLTDEEWLLLMPIRRRRLSEPDYDVPRPHRSLQLQQQRNKQLIPDAIPITRFFGPVLPPNDNTSDDDACRDQPTSWASMDPDSLELEHIPPVLNQNEHKRPFSLNTDQNHSICSYTSHDYLNTNLENPCEHNKNNDKTVYAQPKLYLSSKTMKLSEMNSTKNINKRNGQSKDIATSSVRYDSHGPHIKVQEYFIDSLEPFSEQSTAF